MPANRLLNSALRRPICGALLTATLAIASPSPAESPNVIVVLTDDQGYGDLSCHGNPVLKTPHLDRLHAESVRLTDFHVAPMCTPTRGQLMTGVDALRNGAMNVSSGRTLLRTEFVTLPEIFARSGYRTGLFGKWHLGDNHPYRPQDRGFQESIWFPSSHIPSAPDYWNNDYFDDTYEHNGTRKPFEGYCTDVFFREAMNWMRQCREQQEKFFCYIPLNCPHGPLFVPDRYREPYRDQPRHIASFFGMIANIDENMGRLESFLRESGLRDDTLLLFMTDNGTATGETVFNAGMRGKKISLYDGGHRVPCFVRWPNGGFRVAGDVAALAQVQDIPPTLIDLCGLRKPDRATFDGLSLAPLLRGETESLPDRKLVVQFSRMNRPRPRAGDAAVLWRQWRLVKGEELYNVRTDPGQTNNVIAQHPDVAEAMRTHYDAWWRKVAPRVHEFGALTLGSDQHNPTMLSPCEWQDVFLDQAAQVRRGERKNGVWTVRVERAGEYEFSLRRWPVEADTPLRAGLPKYQAADGVYIEGRALPIAEARLKIGDREMSRRVDEDDLAATFRARLEPGTMDLQTWFLDKDNAALCGAYYVYVTRKAD